MSDSDAPVAPSYGWKNISRQTIATTLAALPLHYFFPAAFNGAVINNGLSMAASSLIGGVVDNLIGKGNLPIKDLMRPALMSGAFCGIFTGLLGLINQPFIQEMIRGESMIYLAIFVFLTQVLADILYKYIKK